MSAIPWLISGSMWYGRPARTIPCFPVSFKYCKTSSPFFSTSVLTWASSFQAFLAAFFVSDSGISNSFLKTS